VCVCVRVCVCVWYLVAVELGKWRTSGAAQCSGLDVAS